MGAKIVKSLVTDKKYVAVQGRDTADGIHLQGEGPEGNRPYGVACTFSAPPEFMEWLQQQAHTLPSLAGTSSAYVPMRARLMANGAVRIQVEGIPLNRSYGACLVVKEPPTVLSDWIAKAMREEDG
jgi:hypothetical protein